jgi:chromosomal replication initiation ATPase DnaA
MLAIDKNMLLQHASTIAKMEDEVSKIFGRPMKLQLVEQTNESIRNIPTVAEIMEGVCKEFDIELKDLKGKVRIRVNTDARSFFFTLMKFFHPELSLKKVGAYLDRDHSTVINSQQQFENFYCTDNIFRNKYDLLKTKLSNPL